MKQLQRPLQPPRLLPLPRLQRPPHLRLLRPSPNPQPYTAAPCIRKLSENSRASARFVAWSWCHLNKPLPLRRRLLPPPRLQPPKKSARSNTGSTPWIPTTCGISQARPPAAWTWCRSMRKPGQRPKPALSPSPPPPSSPWGCGPPRWRSGPCPTTPGPWAW